MNRLPSAFKALGPGTIVTVESGMGGSYDVELIEMAGLGGKWKVKVNMGNKDFDGMEFNALEENMRWPGKGPFGTLEPVTFEAIN